MFIGDRSTVSLAKAPPRIRDKKHLQFLHELPCICTGGMQPIVAHHLLRCSSRLGMSGKSSDSHAVPLLHRVHVELHRNGDEKAFLANYGIADAEALAQKIYDNTGDFEACIQIIGEKQ